MCSLVQLVQCGGDDDGDRHPAVLTELTTELVPEGRELAGPLAGTAAVVGFALVFGLVEVA